MSYKRASFLSLVFFSLLTNAWSVTPPACDSILSEEYRDPLAGVLFVDYEGKRYARTNRTPELVLESYERPAQAFLSKKNLLGKKILDAGCGGQGYFVRSLREDGIEAFGIDLNIDKEAQPNFLLNRDLMNTGFADQSFDIVLSTWSLPTYLTFLFEDENNFTSAKPSKEKAERLGQFRKIIKEFERITKVGGIIMIGPLMNTVFSLEELLAETPGLEPVYKSPYRSYVFKKIK